MTEVNNKNTFILLIKYKYFQTNFFKDYLIVEIIFKTHTHKWKYDFPLFFIELTLKINVFKSHYSTHTQKCVLFS